MLSRRFRLKKESDFRRIYRRGRRIGGIFFAITYLENRGGNRFGIVATTKTIKKASQRNLAKRLSRGFILRAKNVWPANKDLVIKIKKEISAPEKMRAQEEIKKLLARI